MYALITTIGTTLICHPDGTLGHAANGTPMDGRMLQVVAARPDNEAKICLLEAPDSARGIRFGEDGPYEKIVSLQQFGELDGLFFLQHPSDGRYLQLSPLDANGMGIGSFKDGPISETPAFHLLQLSKFPTSGTLARLEDDFSFSGAWLQKLLETGDASFWPLIPNFLRKLNVTDVRGAWSSVVRSSVHDEIFPQINEFCLSKLPRYGDYTIDSLRHYATQFDWSIGEKSIGKPLIFEPSRGKLTIGRYCSLADPRIILGNHATSTPTSYPFMDLWSNWPGTYVGLEDHSARDVFIGNDVWTGVGTTILPGCVIGDGAVIGAGSVVSGTIAPYSICAGVPAKPRRMRFDERTIERLLALQWWDWPDAVVDRFIPLLLSPDPREFLDAAEAEFGRNLVVTEVNS